MTWQGRPTDGDIRKKPSVAFSSVWCKGNETNILDCTTKNGEVYFSSAKKMLIYSKARMGLWLTLVGLTPSVDSKGLDQFP